jgi:hypothetical protein
MKDKILEEALEWYKNQEENPDIEDFVDIVISKTTDSLFKKIKDELRNEFSNGNLKHSFVISSDYYLDLKFKDIKDKYNKNFENNLHSKLDKKIE